MRHSRPMILLALLTAVVPGCNCLNDLDRYSFEGDVDMGPMDQGPDMGEDDAGQDAGEDGGGTITECTDLGAPIEYEIDSLVIPTTPDVLAGRALGHDVDAAGSACGNPDYQGNVDNSLIDLAEALPALAPNSPIHLQDDINRGLACSHTNALCAAPPWTVRVRNGTNCAQITILHGRTDAVLAGPFDASLDGSGNLRGEFDLLPLSILHLPEVGGFVEIPLVVRDGIFTAHMSEHLLSDIVIGGSLLRTEVEAAFTQVIGDLGDGSLDFADISGILENLYDISVMGSCERMSVGLRASASRCPGAGAPTLYRLTTLHVPTPTEASAGVQVGHDVDGVDDQCGVPDYDDQQDNSLIDLVAALPALSPDMPFELQTEIDAALGCAVSGGTCTRLDIYVSIATGNQCALVSIQDASGGVYAAQRAGALSNGELSVRLPTWNLVIPIFRNGGSSVVGARFQDVILTADVSGSALTDVVIGGYSGEADFETFITALLPFFASGVDFNDIGPILSNLYDVQRFGMCGALSVGFLGTGTAVP